ncbi:hypothetical protein H340_30126 [Streptomyces mobaraensis NBRC 13819 = DSM 40847]|uniref:Uncharacterized protein n=1 Tax=Streptomyces mobaraensis (strain ATCC 29032 / DSM 40847 / JCM 4168 / NBRC 13819 / NCIMB 11159 / IPCR 16-22) TaxID=1223523 RepID=M3ASZ0_STRM1|nr:hypothetical protein [Streptomyces mobaraensis]EME96712.1 hypothetical protein H340_30126 [Streptomyces mobaraensis NBRC 13819 = DSM 40847]
MEHTVISADHVHTAETAQQRQRTFVPPSESYLPGVQEPAGDALLDQLFYATVDECPDPTCRPLLLDRVAASVGATRKLVDWACWITSEVYGGLPEELVDEVASAGTIFRPSTTFRRHAAEYHNQGPPFGVMYDACSAAQRREAADNAVVLVDGLQVWWTDFLYQ